MSKKGNIKGKPNQDTQFEHLLQARLIVSTYSPVYASSSRIGAPGCPTSVPEPPGNVKSHFGEHLEQQDGLAWPIGAASGTL